MKKNYALAASLICADPLNLELDLRSLANNKIDYIHFDVMDGQFVPRLGLYPEILTRIKKWEYPAGHFNIFKVDVHVMANDPELYIDTFAKAGANYFVFHWEATNNPHRVIQKIQNAGMKAGVALNIQTKVDVLDYIAPHVEMITLMAINPGIVGSKLNNVIYRKIDDIKNWINRHPYLKKNNIEIPIQIDGGVTFDNARDLIEAGADILVCGNGTIFRPHEGTINRQIEKLREILKLEDVGN